MKPTGGGDKIIMLVITEPYCGDGTPSITPFTLSKKPKYFMVNPTFNGNVKGLPTPESGRLKSTQTELALLFLACSLKGKHQKKTEFYLLH